MHRARVLDHQIVDSATEHLLYCVSDRKTPWHLPQRNNFTLLSKVVITHVAKSKCKLAIYAKVDWTTASLPLASGMIQRAALQDMKLDALDLADVLSDQVRRLVGVHGRTRKAIAIFGQIGQQTQVSEFEGSDSPLNARLHRSRKRRTLTGLALQAVGSFAEAVIASILQIIGNCIRWSWNTITANSLIISFLALSLVANLIFSSRITSEWWRDHKAIRYMSHLGVGSDTIMAKAIYIHDLEDATVSDTLSTSGHPHSLCRDTFSSVIKPSYSYSSFSPTVLSSPTSPTTLQTSTTLHFQATRHHITTRRHDLLVALRIISSIEREIVKAEWEHWILQENARCNHLGRILSHRNKTAEGSKGSENQEQIVDDGRGEMTGEVKEWIGEYCGSCSREREAMAGTDGIVEGF